MSDDIFPPEFDFPPFFTVQPNAETRNSQLSIWLKFVLAYCAKKGIHNIPVSQSFIDQSEMFKNTEINRSLKLDDLHTLLGFMAEKGHGKYLDESKTQFLVLTKTAAEWGDIIYNWAKSMGRINSIETVFNLREGDDTREEAFNGLPYETILAALQNLQSQDKCRVMSTGADAGVKFLNPGV